MPRLLYCESCSHATVIHVIVPDRCRWCRVWQPGWRTERTPWRLTQADARFLRINRIDPEVPTSTDEAAGLTRRARPRPRGSPRDHNTERGDTGSGSWWANT